MEDIRYYPVVDCDSNGTEKSPLFPTTDRSTVIKNHAVWLEEIVPDRYRLCVRDDMEPRATGAFSISCPKCGRKLKVISNYSNSKRLGLYECSSCQKG